jgi:hypothetical protein
VLALDGSTLDALSKTVGLSRSRGQSAGGTHGGAIGHRSLLPRKVWYEKDTQAHDQTFWQGAIEALESGVLLLFDLGFVNYTLFEKLSRQSVWFITRLKTNAVFTIEQTLWETPKGRDVSFDWEGGNNVCATPLADGVRSVSGQVASLSDQCLRS